MRAARRICEVGAQTCNLVGAVSADGPAVRMSEQ